MTRQEPLAARAERAFAKEEFVAGIAPVAARTTRPPDPRPPSPRSDHASPSRARAAAPSRAPARRDRFGAPLAADANRPGRPSPARPPGTALARAARDPARIARPRPRPARLHPPSREDPRHPPSRSARSEATWTARSSLNDAARTRRLGPPAPP